MHSLKRSNFGTPETGRLVPVNGNKLKYAEIAPFKAVLYNFCQTNPKRGALKYMAYNEKFMKLAMTEAKKAEKKGECPIGAVIVYNGEVISKAHNLRETKQLTINHAELLAIKKANKKIGSWRLEDCDLYITLEPCPMCSGAIIQSRIKNVYFGAFDKKAGAAGSVCDLFLPGLFNHNVSVTGGVLKDECSPFLTEFFKNIRKSRKNI